MSNKGNNNGRISSSRYGSLSIGYHNDFLNIETNIDLDKLADRLDYNKSSQYGRLEFDDNDQIEED